MEKLYKITNDKWTGDVDCVCRLSDIEAQAAEYLTSDEDGQEHGETVCVRGRYVFSGDSEVVGVEVETGNNNAEPTGRVLRCPGIEWSCPCTVDGAAHTLYFVTTTEDADYVADHNDDWGLIDWERRATRICEND